MSWHPNQLFCIFWINFNKYYRPLGSWSAENIGWHGKYGRQKCRDEIEEMSDDREKWCKRKGKLAPPNKQGKEIVRQMLQPRIGGQWSLGWVKYQMMRKYPECRNYQRASLAWWWCWSGDESDQVENPFRSQFVSHKAAGRWERVINEYLFYSTDSCLHPLDSKACLRVPDAFYTNMFHCRGSTQALWWFLKVFF